MHSAVSSEEQDVSPCRDLVSPSFFPHFVCRVAGLPVDHARSLRASGSEHLLDQFFALEAQLDRDREAISQLLYEEIGRSEDKKKRRDLLTLKRDLYNLRVGASTIQAAMGSILPATVVETLEAFCRLIEARNHTQRDLERTYHTELQAARRRFQVLLKEEDFQKGLLLSSRSLFASQRKYIGFTGTELGGKREKIERGLLRYFTRAAMKATPFGTLCAVLPGRFVDAVPESQGRSEVFFFDGDPRQKTSAIRLNKSLYGILLNHLKTRAAVTLELHLELNPTLRKEAGRWVFLAASPGGERFYRLANNPSLELVGSVTRRHGHLALRRLLHELTTHPALEASEEDALQYLDKLLEVGFLRFRTGIREQEVDWDEPLQALLEPIDDAHAQETVTLLRYLRQQTKVYETASVDRRLGLLRDIEACIETAFEAMGINARLFSSMSIYEDATASAVPCLTRSEELMRLLDCLQEYARLTFPLVSVRSEQATMRHFFDTFYKDQASSIPLLEFYETYFREHFKAHLEKRRNARHGGGAGEAEGDALNNPFGLDLILRIQEARKQLRTVIAQRWQATPEAEALHLNAEDLGAVLRGIPSPPRTCRSVSLFTDIVPPTQPGEMTRLIVRHGGYLGGYGKFFSRFLYLFPESVQAELRRANGTLTTEHLAEICGDANFNGNLHPPLLPWEISYPTGESGDSEEQILCSELLVEPDAADPYALCLRHMHTGKRVVPVDLGFLKYEMRPALFQLLYLFSPAPSFSLLFPELPVTGHENDATTRDRPLSPPVTYRPRIVYEQRLVLARKRWRVLWTAFPVRERHESDSAYFVRVNRWRREHRIPREVYVRVHRLPEPGRPQPPDPAQRNGEVARPPAEPEKPTLGGKAPLPEAAPPEASPVNSEQRDTAQQPPLGGASRPPFTRFSRDLYKPQYIDFSNPLLVNLFGKMTLNIKRFIVFLDERYPPADALPRYDGKAYATELILQADFPDEAQPSPDHSFVEQHYAV